MMKKTFIVTAIARLNNSRFGNPRFKIQLSDNGLIIDARTATDSAAGYAVSNLIVGDIAFVTYHVTRSGNCIVDYIKAVD